MEDNQKKGELFRSYSNGKLLLTGEYFVLEGAKSLAVPTTCGQDLLIEPINEHRLIWNSYSNEGECWLEAIFDLPKLRLVSTTFNSVKEGGDDIIAEKLNKILVVAKKLNPNLTCPSSLIFMSLIRRHQLQMSQTFCSFLPFCLVKPT